MSNNYGITWKLDDDFDIEFDDDGDVKIIEDVETVSQSLRVLFMTQFKEDLLVPVYGFDRESILGADLRYDDQVKLFELNVQQAAYQDDRVAYIVDLVTMTEKRVGTIDMKLQLLNGEMISLSIEEIL
ncbi:MAG: hypothetical protein ACTSRA_00405 [Promethearchaeota archaeon]|nr:MAG: hypothetical protein [Helarchaeota virus Nidhogg Meg22_1012]URC17416.1 MAG: hypothetical protein [Helarchaeota virus Nidhogg Meg22_1214]